MAWVKTHWKALLFLLFLILFAVSALLADVFVRKFTALQSTIILDRNSKVIGALPNSRGYYSRPTEILPETFKEALLQKEDRYFYYHPGFNPVSMIRRPTGGSSTITQQLAKITLGNEFKRNVPNKIVETVYAFSLEIWKTKEEILDMYSQSVYLGNLAQGFEEASYTYYNKPLKELGLTEANELLQILSSPASRAPERHPDYSHNSPTLFELKSLFSLQGQTPESLGDQVTKLTIDTNLTEKIRGFMAEIVEKEGWRGVTNGAVVVIKIPENEVLAIVGSPDPTKSKEGAQINMALQPRPIGSTIKPFIYARAFEKGLRPYSTIEDREYKYSIGTGFALYPKNYDGKYRGTVTAAESLANSLNVPAVKTLEFVTLPEFYQILENKLAFKPLQELDSYQLGIALGGLEMDPLTLAYYFTIFAQNGTLKPLSIEIDQTFSVPMVIQEKSEQIFGRQYVELVNKILSDRALAVDQFGMKSNLDLGQNNYAVKTGTSRDYHDSWTVGWTPDYVVLAWVGNAENKALAQVSGQAGAGKLWRQTMELLVASDYNKKTPLPFSHIQLIDVDGKLSFGLPGENPTKHKSLLAETNLITSPHEGDIFELPLLRQGYAGQALSIPLSATETVTWFVNNKYIGQGKNITFAPQLTGRYKIEAEDVSGKKESVSIAVTQNE